MADLGSKARSVRLIKLLRFSKPATLMGLVLWLPSFQNLVKESGPAMVVKSFTWNKQWKDKVMCAMGLLGVEVEWCCI